MEFDKLQLGNTIRSHRLALGFTQEYLAEQVDITATHMKHLESGHRMPSIEVLYRLVQILHISLDELWLSDNTSQSEIKKELTMLLTHCSEKEFIIIADLCKSLIKNR